MAGDVLDQCPQCGTTITAAWRLIVYETGVWATCPECDDVVGPE